MSNSPEKPQKSEAQQFLDEYGMPVARDAYGKINKLVDTNVDEGVTHKGAGPQLTESLKYKLKENVQSQLDQLAEELPKTTKDQWMDLLGNMEKEIGEYMPVIEQEIGNLAQKNGGKLSLEQVRELTLRTQGLALMLEKKLGDTYNKIVTGVQLTPQDYQKIVSEIKPDDQKEPSEFDAADQLQKSVVGSLVMAMSPAQRLKLAQEFERTRPAESKALIESFLEAKILTVAQGQKLWKSSWEPYPEAKIAAQQRELEKAQEEVQKNYLERPDASNQMVKFIQPRNLLGVGIQIWRGTNLFLNVFPAVYKKDFAGLVKNPWVYVDIASIAAGRAIARGRILPDYLKQPSAVQKESKENLEQMQRMAELLSRYPDAYTSYLAKGGSEVVLKAIEEKRQDKKNLTLSVAELLEIEKNIPNAAAKDTDREKYLQNLMNEPAKRIGADELLTQMASSTYLQFPKDIDDIYKESMKNQGIA